jgi:hypothetical protein
MRRVVALLFIGALIGVFTWRTLEIRHLRRELRQLDHSERDREPLRAPPGHQ